MLGYIRHGVKQPFQLCISLRDFVSRSVRLQLAAVFLYGWVTR